MSVSNVKVTFTLPASLVKQFKKEFKEGERSKVVADGIERTLHLKKRSGSAKFLREVRSSLPQPKIKNIVEFIRKDRRSH